MTILIKGIFLFYRLVLSPLIHTLSGAGAGCRFNPTCSVYCEEILRTQGIKLKTIKKCFKRIASCHPYSSIQE